MDEAEGLGFLQTLLRDVPDDDAVGYVLQRFARAIGGSAILFDEAGAVLEKVGEAPAYLFWSEIATAPNRSRALHVGRWQAVSRLVSTTRRPIVIVLATRAEVSPIRSTTLDAFEVAVLAVFAHMSGTDQRQRRDRELLLTSLEEGIRDNREHRYWPRLQEFGFVPHAPLRAIVSERLSRSVLDAQALDDALDDARVSGVPLLITNRIPTAAADTIVHTIVPATPAALAFVRRRTATSIVGVSATFSRLVEVPTAFRQAEIAFGVAAADSRAKRELDVEAANGEWVEFDRMRLTTWLMATGEPQGVRARRQRLLEPLRAHPELRRTLVVYLAHAQNVMSTATALFVHANTVRYRLGRIAELLGEPIGSTALVASLYLCLEAEVSAVARAASRDPEVSM